MPRPSQGSIPSELGFLIDLLDDYERRLRILEAPSGEALGNTVAKLAESIAQTVKPTSFYRFESPASIAPTVSAAAAASVPVPDGYTRAVVNATAAVTLRSDQGGGGWSLLMVGARITPNGGVSFFNQWASIDDQKYGGASASAAATLEGLAPGSTIDVEALANFPAAYTLPRASVAGSILFLR